MLLKRDVLLKRDALPELDVLRNLEKLRKLEELLELDELPELDELLESLSFDESSISFELELLSKSLELEELSSKSLELDELLELLELEELLELLPLIEPPEPPIPNPRLVELLPPAPIPPRLIMPAYAVLERISKVALKASIALFISIPSMYFWFICLIGSNFKQQDLSEVYGRLKPRL